MHKLSFSLNLTCIHLQMILKFRTVSFQHFINESPDEGRSRSLNDFFLLLFSQSKVFNLKMLYVTLNLHCYYYTNDKLQSFKEQEL